MTTFKISALCLVGGCISGAVTVLLGCYTGYLVWSALAIVLFVLALFLALFMSWKFRWIVIDVSRRQLSIASMCIIAIYPVSLSAMLVMALWRLYFTYGRDSLAFDRFSYSTLFEAPIDQIFDERSTMLPGLTFGIILGAMLVALSLRVITRKWDRRVLILMVLSILVTPFLNHILALTFIPEGRELFGWLPFLFSSASTPALNNPQAILRSIYPEPELFCRNDFIMQVFPLGNAFIAALCGYWPKRTSAL